MKKYFLFFLSLLMVLSIVGMAACAGSTTTVTKTTTAPGTTVTQTSPPTTITQTATVTKTVTGTQPPTSPTGTIQTAGVLALAGNDVYDVNCSINPYCHLVWGQGGKEQFTNYKLNIYINGQGFFDFIKYYMPNGFVGSIPDDQLLQVEAFVLVGTGRLAETESLGMGILDTITIPANP